MQCCLTSAVVLCKMYACTTLCVLYQVQSVHTSYFIKMLSQFGSCTSELRPITMKTNIQRGNYKMQIHTKHCRFGVLSPS